MPTKRSIRLKEIRKVIRNNLPKNNDIGYILQKYKYELKKYKYISDLKNITIGGYIKYVDLNISKIKYGILARISKDIYDNQQIHLKRTYNNNVFYWKILPLKYYIFYKPHSPNKTSAIRKIINEYLAQHNKKHRLLPQIQRV